MKHYFNSQDISEAMSYQWNMAQNGYKTSLQRVAGIWTATAYKMEENDKDFAA